MHEAGQARSTTAAAADDASASLLHRALASTSTPVLITDAEGIICHANRAFEQATGYAIGELCGCTTALLRSQMQGEPFYRELWGSLLSQQRWHGEIWNRHKDGRVLREWVSISALLAANGQVSHYLAVYATLPDRPPADGQDAEAARLDVRGGQLARALREAIMADQIELALQPKVVLSSGKLCGMEALARWTMADGRVVPPSEFIPLAEQRGMIVELGERVLERVLALLASWQRAGHELVPIAVNFSPQQLHRRDAAQRVQQALQRHGVAPELLELELTESVLLGDVDAALYTLTQLRQLGVKVAIDDFGTGYSSLAYLRRFPVDCLKIDRSFVADMASDARSAEIVRVIIQLARRFELRCVAEGIESAEQLGQLRELGCDEGQGYLLARPMPCAMVTELMALRVPWMPLFALL